MEKIFGLFLISSEELLGVMTENTFLSKSTSELEVICFNLIFYKYLGTFTLEKSYTNMFEIEDMTYSCKSNYGNLTIEFRELNIIK